MNKKGMFPVIDLMSTILLIIMVVFYTWLFVYSDARDFLGDNEVQKIETLKTPSNFAYGESFLNMPFEEDMTIVDYIVSSPEDYSKLESHLNLLFEDTEFKWYIALYSSPSDEVPVYVIQRKDWRFKDGFRSYENYIIPSYFEEDSMKVTLAFGNGIWIPGEEIEKAYNSPPGAAIGSVV